MSDSEKTLDYFAARVRQLILSYQDLLKENAELYAMVDERDAKIKKLEEELTASNNDNNTLKTARMLAITDGDMDSAKRRLARMIREVDRCITLLSEQ